MILLAIDSISERPGAALWRDGEIFFKEPSVTEKLPRASDLLLPFLSELLATHSVPLDSIEALAITAGPGSFTGIRVGMSLVKGLFFRRSIRVASVNTLDILERIRPGALPTVALRKTEWIIRSEGEIRSVDAEGWRSASRGSGVIALGNVPEAHAADVTRATSSFAEVLATVGAEMIRRGEEIALDRMTPLYPRSAYVS